MHDRKNILVICKGHPNIAGAQRYLQQVIDVFDPSVYDLHFAYHHKDGSRVFREIAAKRKVIVWEYDWRHIGFLASFQEARKLMRRVQPWRVLYNSSEDEIAPAIFAAVSLQVPFQTMVVHWAQRPDALPLFVKKISRQFPRLSRYALLTRIKRFIAYAFLSNLIFVNAITRNAYIKLYWVKASKCATVYNGIVAEKYRLSTDIRDRIRNQLSLSDSHIMILATGNLTKVKGHHYLIKAVKDLKLEGVPVKCFIAGQGELENSLLDFIRKNHLENAVSLLGYRDDIPYLLAAADIFCMPSLNEALGYSLIEAMAAGKPVIASNVGGIPEVISDKVNGLLVPPGDPKQLKDAIYYLSKNKEIFVTLGEKAIDTVNSRFSLSSMLQATANLL